MDNARNSNNNLSTVLIGRLLALAVIFAILFIGLGISKCSREVKEEVLFSQDLKRNYPAYVDVTSIIPEYSISQGYGGYVSDVVCQCKTTSGDVVWVYISTSDYKEFFDPDAEFSNQKYGSSFKKVQGNFRIHGVTREADAISSGLARNTAEMILRFESLEIIK